MILIGASSAQMGRQVRQKDSQSGRQAGKQEPTSQATQVQVCLQDSTKLQGLIYWLVGLQHARAAAAVGGGSGIASTASQHSSQQAGRLAGVRAAAAVGSGCGMGQHSQPAQLRAGWQAGRQAKQRHPSMQLQRPSKHAGAGALPHAPAANHRHQEL